MGNINFTFQEGAMDGGLKKFRLARFELTLRGGFGHAMKIEGRTRLT